MRKIILSMAGLAAACNVQAQKSLFIYKNDGVALGVPTSSVEGLTFNSDNTITTLTLTNGQTYSYEIAAIDSFSVKETTEVVTIAYNGLTAQVINPLAFHGVSVTVTGADVVVNSTSTEELEYRISGTTTDG